jgi:hypothetical protein
MISNSDMQNVILALTLLSIGAGISYVKDPKFITPWVASVSVLSPLAGIIFLFISGVNEILLNESALLGLCFFSFSSVLIIFSAAFYQKAKPRNLIGVGLIFTFKVISDIATRLLF